MQISPDIRDVVGALKGILEGHKDVIDARLAQVISGVQPVKILDHYSLNIDTGMYPLLMIEQVSESGQWIAFPEISDDRASLRIWGLVHQDREEFMEPLVGRFAGAVRDIVNRRHHPMPAGTFEIYFNEEKPISRIEYGAAQYGSAIVRGFTAEFNASFTYQIRDEHAGIGNLQK